MKQKFKLVKGNEVKVTKSQALVDILTSKYHGWKLDDKVTSKVKAEKIDI